MELMVNPFRTDTIEHEIWEYGYLHAFDSTEEIWNDDNPYFSEDTDYEYLVFGLGCYASGYNSSAAEFKDGGFSQK